MQRSHWEEIVDHARAEAPNECCGYLRARDGAVEEVVRARSLRPSPYAYELEGSALLAANQLDEEGYEVGIYHSHPRSAPEPSQTDINLAHYPSWRYLIVSLQHEEPLLRAWRIDDGKVEEEQVEVE